MDRSDFLNLLDENKVLVFDGAMGTMLYERGVPRGHCYDELNLSNPDVVRGIHEDYIKAGADVITTNTFGSNRFILGRYYDLAKKVGEINFHGARIAVEAAGSKLVAGSIGPISRPAELYTELTPEEIADMYREQVESLLEGGVDLIIFETSPSLEELKTGIRITREIDRNIPVIAEMTFPAEGRTLKGVTPRKAGYELGRTEADVVGINCGTGPKNSLSLVKKMGTTTAKKLCVMPNAGLARFDGGWFSYPFHPEYFARYARKFLKAGVSVLGGCCGTTPRHIEAIRESVEGLEPEARKKVDVSVKETPPEVERVEVDTTLSGMLKRKFITSVEVDPPRGPSLDDTLSRIRKFKGLGVDAINVSDGPMARLRMSPAGFASSIRTETGLEVILHVTCRDRNLLGIQSSLLGYAATGIENILALTGDPPSLGDYPFATGVYDVTSRGLVSIANHLNQGIDFLQNPINGRTNFFTGAGSPACPVDMKKEIELLKSKIKEGAHFIQTQPVYDIEGFEKFFQEIKKIDVPLIASVMPPSSLSGIQYLANEVPGIEIPEEFIKKMEEARSRDEEKKIGIEIGRRIMKELRGIGVSGVCLMSAGEKYEFVESILH